MSNVYKISLLSVIGKKLIEATRSGNDKIGHYKGKVKSSMTVCFKNEEKFLNKSFSVYLSSIFFFVLPYKTGSLISY